MASLKTLSVKAPRKPRKDSKSSKDLEAFKDIADDVIESDFVPYACLFDPSTIATKDGELIQTLKITGLGYDANRQSNLRDTIREAIKTTLPDASYAVWLHTLRRKVSATSRTHFPDAFSGKIDETWRTQQPASLAYVNELYVSIVRASGPVSLLNANALKQSFRPNHDLALRTEAMEDMLRELNGTIQNMLTLLQPFGARLLTTVERNGVFYNEQVEFLEKLINLEERPMPLPERDLSHVLTSGEITFGFNAMEVRTAEGVRRFAAILTLKEYKESTLAGIDKFLEIPCEVIISQCFDFTGASVAREAYEKQARYLKYSGDKELAKWMEIDRLMATTDADSSKSFGQQQTSIFLIASGVNQLEANIRMVQRTLNKLGLLVIREDLRFEECYWSQLPANFTFISRKHAVDTEHLAGFVNLQAAPMGNASGSPWGPPVTLFTTVQDAPYYFNFHRQNVAHTVVIGKPKSGHTTFAHFLLAQSRKLPIRLWYLDVRGRGTPLIQAMGGETFRVGSAECKLNPLLLPETPANREFLALWLSTLIDPSGRQLNRSTLAFFQSVIDSVLQLPREHRRMAAVIHYVREADALLAASLQRYAAGGAFGELFDMPEDTLTPGKLSLWDIGRWMNDPATRVPLTGYLLHRLTGLVDQAPTMIVLDEGFLQLDTPLFSARIAPWLDYLTQHNSAAFIMSQTIEESAAMPYTAAICSRAATLFAMADPYPEAGYMLGMGMSPEEVSTLTVIDRAAHHVLQKRANETVVIKADLGMFPPSTLHTLSGRIPTSQQSPADVLANLMGYTKQAV